MTHSRPERPTPEQVKRVLQESLLRNYPNPDRQGCRGADVLREMAQRELPHEHSFWDAHVCRCSPCYREFLDFRNDVLAKESRSRNSRYAIAALIGVLLIGGTVYFSLRAPSPVQPASVAPSGRAVQVAVVDLERASVTRGPGGDSGGNETPRLSLSKLDLAIHLPTGSEPGEYDIQLLQNGTTGSPLVNAKGNAQIENYVTVLRASVDLSPFAPGAYVLAIRRVSGEWRFYRVDLS